MTVSRTLSQLLWRTLITLVGMFNLDRGLAAVVSILYAYIDTSNCINVSVGLLAIALALVIKSNVFLGLGCLLLSLLFRVNRQGF